MYVLMEMIEYTILEKTSPTSLGHGKQCKWVFFVI